ncbi:hypothetical protein [Rhodococcoides fascians]|uniref:hypothetical protein n=1 Tax=Rhodococcoides fascians TaxID=1828 RepID=UPI000689BB45|nr:hypothetical protein [Rhodococcus fascians]
MRFPERWLIQEPAGAAEVDPSTGNRKPGVLPEPVPVRGLLQQRQLSASSVDAGNSEFIDGHVTSVYMLLLKPSSPSPSPSAVLIDADGQRYQVVANSRPRRPVRGVRKPAYIAVMVRRSNDME